MNVFNSGQFPCPNILTCQHLSIRKFKYPNFILTFIFHQMYLLSSCTNQKPSIFPPKDVVLRLNYLFQGVERTLLWSFYDFTVTFLEKKNKSSREISRDATNAMQCSQSIVAVLPEISREILVSSRDSSFFLLWNDTCVLN